jgi:hypothetical protein
MRFGWERFEVDLPRSGSKGAKGVVGVEVCLARKIRLLHLHHRCPIPGAQREKRGNR